MFHFLQALFTEPVSTGQQLRCRQGLQTHCAFNMGMEVRNGFSKFHLDIEFTRNYLVLQMMYRNFSTLEQQRQKPLTMLTFPQLAAFIWGHYQRKMKISISETRLKLLFFLIASRSPRVMSQHSKRYISSAILNYGKWPNKVTQYHRQPMKLWRKCLQLCNQNCPCYEGNAYNYVTKTAPVNGLVTLGSSSATGTVMISSGCEYRPCLIRPKPDLDFKIRILKPWGCKQTECWIRIRFPENKCKSWI